MGLSATHQLRFSRIKRSLSSSTNKPRLPCSSFGHFGMAGVTPPTAARSPCPPPGQEANEISLWYFRTRDRAQELFSKKQLQRQQRPHGAHHLVAGTTAGLVTTAALYPLDLVKTRYQAREGEELVYHDACSITLMQ